MSDYVWVSNALPDSQLIVFVGTDIVESDVTAAIEGEKLAKSGASVPSELCPKKIWASDDVEPYDRMPEQLPDLFYAKTQWIVSARAANVLRQFDLGGGSLHPVTEGIYREDRTTQVGGEYFCWIFGNVKSAFLPEQTPDKRKFGVAGLRWKMPWKLTDGNIAVSREALVGPDVWIDPNLFKSLFLSGPLGDALVAAGLREAFRLCRARVV